MSCLLCVCLYTFRSELIFPVRSPQKTPVNFTSISALHTLLFIAFYSCKYLIWSSWLFEYRPYILLCKAVLAEASWPRVLVYYTSFSSQHSVQLQRLPVHLTSLPMYLVCLWLSVRTDLVLDWAGNSVLVNAQSGSAAHPTHTPGHAIPHPSYANVSSLLRLPIFLHPQVQIVPIFLRFSLLNHSYQSNSNSSELLCSVSLLHRPLRIYPACKLPCIQGPPLSSLPATCSELLVPPPRPPCHTLKTLCWLTLMCIWTGPSSSREECLPLSLIWLRPIFLPVPLKHPSSRKPFPVPHCEMPSRNPLMVSSCLPSLWKWFGNCLILLSHLRRCTSMGHGYRLRSLILQFLPPGPGNGASHITEYCLFPALPACCALNPCHGQLCG